MTQQKNNTSKESGKLYITNIILTAIIGYCALYELFIRYNITNTGLQYKIVNLASPEVSTENDNEKQYFIVERTVSYRGKIIEYPNQYGARPFIYDRKNHISRLKFNGKYEEALSMLKNKGDEIQIKIRCSDVIYEYGIPPLKADRWNFVVINLKLVDNVTEGDLQEVFKKYRADREKDYEEKVKIERKNIETYLQKHKYNVTAQKNNMYIVETEKGKGEKINAGDEVEIKYFFHQYKGKILQTNIEEVAKKNKLKKEEIFKMQVSEDKQDFLSEALVHLSNSSKGYIFFPSVDHFDLDPSKSFWIFYLEIVGVTKKEELEKKKKEQELKSQKANQQTTTPEQASTKKHESKKNKEGLDNKNNNSSRSK